MHLTFNLIHSTCFISKENIKTLTYVKWDSKLRANVNKCYMNSIKNPGHSILNVKSHLCISDISNEPVTGSSNQLVSNIDKTLIHSGTLHLDSLIYLNAKILILNPLHFIARC